MIAPQTPASKQSEHQALQSAWRASDKHCRAQAKRSTVWTAQKAKDATSVPHMGSGSGFYLDVGDPARVRGHVVA